MEADPGTFDLTRIKGYQEVGVQRFSIGVQAFDEASSRLIPVLSQHAVQGQY